MSYNPRTDLVLQTLLAEATADPDVIGLVLTGSRAIGGVAPDSDYDVVFVVTDEALARYQQTKITPTRGATIDPAIRANDIWHEAPSTLQLTTVVEWMLPAWAEARILYERSGETTRLIDALRCIPVEQAQQAIITWSDAGKLGELYVLWGKHKIAKEEAGQSTKMKHYVHKACPVILRQVGDTWQILAFRHPKAGTQLIKGTVEEDERPEETVLRELAEESGLEQTVIVQKIGTLGFRATKQHWHLFLCEPLVAPPDDWSFFTKDGGGQLFRFFWHELAAEPDETWHPQFRSALRFIRTWHQGRTR